MKTQVDTQAVTDYQRTCGVKSLDIAEKSGFSKIPFNSFCPHHCASDWVKKKTWKRIVQKLSLTFNTKSSQLPAHTDQHLF